MRRLLTDIFKLVASGVLQPPTPLAEFGLDRVQAAFRHLQSGKDGGKVVVNMEGSQRVTVRQEVTPSWTLKADCSYLLAGGLGGLGREVARWMVQRGARSLILLSKSGPGDDETRLALLDDLKDAGCNAMVIACDISKKSALEAALLECRKTMPRIEGCIQGSMVLRDSYFSDMTLDDWKESTAPKIEGTTTLDQVLPTGLDFFVLMSSLVGVVGTVGQSNYAAGCAFQDAVARCRVARGEKAISLDLGMIVDEGVVAEDVGLARTMESFGHYQPMTMKHVEALLNRFCDPGLPVLSKDDCQIVCGIRPPAALHAKGFKKPNWMALPTFQPLHGLNIGTAVQETADAPQDSYK